MKKVRNMLDFLEGEPLFIWFVEERRGKKFARAEPVRFVKAEWCSPAWAGGKKEYLVVCRSTAGQEIGSRLVHVTKTEADALNAARDHLGK